MAWFIIWNLIKMLVESKTTCGFHHLTCFIRLLVTIVFSHKYHVDIIKHKKYCVIFDTLKNVQFFKMLVPNLGYSKVVHGDSWRKLLLTWWVLSHSCGSSVVLGHSRWFCEFLHWAFWWFSFGGFSVSVLWLFVGF